jgi:hypothetical protein
VSLRDIAATVWAAVAPDEPSPFPGASLLGPGSDARRSPYVFSEVSADPAILRADPDGMVDLASVSSKSWHYIHAITGAEELFPVVGTEAADQDVAADTAWRAVLDSARAALSAHRDSRRGPNVR